MDYENTKSNMMSEAISGRRETKLDRLLEERNRLQHRLHVIDRKIELIDKNPIIAEYLELDN